MVKLEEIHRREMMNVPTNKKNKKVINGKEPVIESIFEEKIFEKRN